MRTIAGLHTGYLVLTGIWPLVHRRSFETLTGRKTDYWLVRTVGGLALACGLAMGSAVIRGRPSPEIQILAGAQAVVFVLADLYASKKQSRNYLLDVAIQALCLPAWLGGGRPASQNEERPDGPPLTHVM
jgi:hypothetical protein